MEGLSKFAFVCLALSVVGSFASPLLDDLREEQLLPVPKMKPAQKRSVPGVDCPAVDPAYPVYFADPADCRSFYQCSHGVPYHFTCPADLNFDPNLNTCNYPFNYQCEGGEGSGSNSIVP